MKTIQVNEHSNLIVGNDINKIIDYCIPRIRKISQEYYRKEIKNDLEKNAESWIDIHAGMGMSSHILLRENFSIKLFHIPTEKQLKRHPIVAYKDKNGEFTKIGQITKRYENKGIKLYNIFGSMGSFINDELRLLK
ncbi:hypothetical protein HN014_22375 (plasmid) [Aquimarina sp. TRL1]|uniref:hypothetical protein n=1 Tax=Aquimarina sp. (strain TRL1) TaxID=2736252 RepID=UPI00158C2DC8|nr:hypothetical protein [Aquimarina sp. TRL1]QKX07748.1 hypothetical protein HN014_22375 [Aquimarina sp. TRL1]